MSETDTAIDDAQELADFAGGFEGKTAEKVAHATQAKDKSPPAAEAPRAEEAATPEYVQITKEELSEMRAAAAKTASYDQQFAKAFGTIGGLQRHINELKGQPSAPPAPAGSRKIEIPKDAFAAMERDFPELAQQTKAALEAALSGVVGTGADIDIAKVENKIKEMLVSHVGKREIEILEDAYPEWQTIVGAVSKDQQPDLDHPFRKWLGTKSDAYQKRVNGTESAAVITRAIRTYQNETKAPAKPNTPNTPTPRNDARAERIKAAVQPRGDNAGGSAGKTEQDDFEAGFHSR